MGQLHYIINLDKKEWFSARNMGRGAKLSEQAINGGGSAGALLLLLAATNGRGGGDVYPDPLVGSWAGDRIAVIGEYVKEDDIPGIDAKAMMLDVFDDDTEWRDLSDDLTGLLNVALYNGPMRTTGVFRPDFGNGGSDK